MDSGGGHSDDGDTARGQAEGHVVSNEVRGFVAINDGHLYVHEDDVGFGVRGVGNVGGEEVVEGLFAVPDGGNEEAEFADGAKGDLLVYLANRC